MPVVIDVRDQQHISRLYRDARTGQYILPFSPVAGFENLDKSAVGDPPSPMHHQDMTCPTQDSPRSPGTSVKPKLIESARQIFDAYDRTLPRRRSRYKFSSSSRNMPACISAAALVMRDGDMIPTQPMTPVYQRLPHVTADCRNAPA